jgi:hypothetical protein
MGIDTNKWTVNNLDPIMVRIEKNTAIELINLGGTPNNTSLFIRNSVVSKKYAGTGTFGFTANSIYPMSSIYHAFGLYVDANNRIEFYRKNSANYKVSFRIVLAGNTVYEVDDVVKDFGKYEIRVTAANAISAFIYNGSSWTQIGESQTAEMGNKYLFASTCGGEVSKLSLSYCYIKL